VRTTDEAGQARVTLTAENGDSLTICLDENRNGRCDDSGGFQRGWFISWTEPPTYSFAVYPLRAALPLGGSTTVTAWLRQGTSYGADVRVLWKVTSGPDATDAWQLAGTTDSAGQVNWSFTVHSSQSGIDVLEACADLDRNAQCGETEPRASTAIWVGYADEIEQTTEAQLFGQPVTVRYRAQLGGQPVQNLPILFEVRPPSGISADPASATVNTDQQGEAAFTLTASNTVADPLYRGVTVVACADLNRSGRCDGGIEVPAEPQEEARIGWGFAAEVRLRPWPGPSFAYLRAGADVRQFTVTVELVDARYNVWGGIAGQAVIAAATGATTWSASTTTAWDGTATFSYQGANGGEDRLVICLDSNQSGACEGTEQTIGDFRTAWVSSVTASPAGHAVDNDEGTRWTAGDTEPDLELRLSLEPAGISAPLIVELSPAGGDGATVGFDASGAVRSAREWVSSSGVSLPVYVVEGAAGQRFTVRVWLDRFGDGLATDDPVVDETTVTLTA
jgi:hypothetical protein